MGCDQQKFEIPAFVPHQFSVIFRACCASEQLIVSYFSVIKPLLFSSFQESLLFALLRICDPIISEMKLLRLKRNKMGD